MGFNHYIQPLSDGDYLVRVIDDRYTVDEYRAVLNTYINRGIGHPVTEVLSRGGATNDPAQVYNLLVVFRN